MEKNQQRMSGEMVPNDIFFILKGNNNTNIAPFSACVLFCVYLYTPKSQESQTIVKERFFFHFLGVWLGVLVQSDVKSRAVLVLLLLLLSVV